MDMLTDDLITKIMVRVPVKYLLRCKSVSKPWFSLISSPNFIDSQLRHVGADQTLIGYTTDDRSTSLLHLDSLQVEAPLGLPFSRGDFSFEPDFEIVDSCNGVVCVFVSNFPRSRVLFHTNWYEKGVYDNNNPNFYLWNPATKHSKLIPPPNIRGRDIGNVGKGFGFDPIGNDFKVLRIVSLCDEPRCAEIYSANMDVWRMVEHGPCDFPDCDDFDVCVNGFLLCVGFYGMMAFDLDKEVFNCGIKLPVSYEGVPVSYEGAPHVTNFNDCVAFINFENNESYLMITLWTLDDEACLRDGGVEASWTLMLSVDVELPIWRVYGYFTGGLLLNITEGGKILYNSDKKEAITVPDSFSMSRTIKYNESLVSISGFKQVD